MNPNHPACWNADELLAHCKLTFSRASGPGGQNRNKVETSVKVEFQLANISAQASELRTQNENRVVAMLRLRCRLAVELDWGTSVQDEVPSDLWARYSRNGRMNISETNAEWPALLSELIGCLRREDWDLGVTAELLKTSSSQLIKLLKKYAPAMKLLNDHRTKQGQRPLA